MSDNLYFMDLPIGITEEQLKEILGAYGAIASTKLLVKPGLKPHALIRYSTAEDAKWVLENLNGNIPQGLTEPIQVRVAGSHIQKGGGGGGGGAKGSWGADSWDGKGADSWDGMGMDAWDSMMAAMDAWGGMDGWGMDSWGPCKGGWKGGGGGPYGGGGKGWGGGGGGKGWGGGGGGGGAGGSWSPGPALDPNAMPEVTWLEIDPSCKLVQAGFPNKGCAIEHSKLDVFSEAHYWCQEFFEETLKEACNFESDADGYLYPEVYTAWKAAGRSDNIPLVVSCPKYGVWAVGFGGKKNAERSAKLAMATILAKVVDATQLAAVTSNYPAFGQYLAAVGALEA